MHRWDTLQRLLGRGSSDLVPLVARSTDRSEDEANELLLQSSAAVARQVRARGQAGLPGLGQIRLGPTFEMQGFLEASDDPDAVAWMSEVEGEPAAIAEACQTAARALAASAVTTQGVRWPGLGVLRMTRTSAGLQPEVRWERRFTGLVRGRG